MSKLKEPRGRRTLYGTFISSLLAGQSPFEEGIRAVFQKKEADVLSINSDNCLEVDFQSGLPWLEVG